MIDSVPALQTMYEIFPDILCLVVLNLLVIIELNTRLSVGLFITMCCCIAIHRNIPRFQLGQFRFVAEDTAFFCR